MTPPGECERFEIIVPLPYSKGDPNVKCGTQTAKLHMTRGGAKALVARLLEAIVDCERRARLPAEEAAE